MIVTDNAVLVEEVTVLKCKKVINSVKLSGFPNTSNMSNREDEKGESEHAPHSQDTELIEGNLSYLDIPHSPFTAGARGSDPLISSPFVEGGSSEDPSLLDLTSPNASTTTACSTPHESKLLGTVLKRRFALSSDESVGIKKQKLFEKDLDKSETRTEKSSLSSDKLDTESTQEVSSSSSEVRTLGWRPTVKYAKANSSTSSSKANSNSSTDSVEKIMVNKIRSSDDSVTPKSPLRKAYSDDYNGTDSTAQKEKILELEAQVRHLQQLLSSRNRDEAREQSKEGRGKHATEKLLCTVSYLYDEVDGEITSLAIKQVNKGDFFDQKHPRLSISSGSLADSSGSEMVNHWIQRGPSLPSYCSSASVTSSSSSSFPSQAGKSLFLVPQVPKKHWTYKYPKTCVCHCFCSAVIDCLAKQPLRCTTPETLSSSSENIKPDSRDSSSISIEQQTVPPRVASPDSEKAQEFRSRSSVYVPTGENLPVFAKWPSNSFCYPGIIKNATEDTWHRSSHLEVTFCDGTVKKILSENLFPAYLLPAETEISFENDDTCETTNLISIERLENNELVCFGEPTKGMLEMVKIPFEKIFLSDYCYKGLKKLSASSLTPKKTPRFSISTANVTEGKRTRKVVKFEGSNQKESLESSSCRKTRSRVKRVRSTTETSGSDVPKSDKKKGRPWKKQVSRPDEQTASTPHGSIQERPQVSRKLYEALPGCSSSRGAATSPGFGRSRPLEPEERPPSSSIDSDNSIDRDVDFDAIKEHNLDNEKVINISTRASKPKSLAKRNGIGAKNDKVKGPIPEKLIFSGYSFVLTQSDPKINPVERSRTALDSCSEEGSSTDFEEYYALPGVPFDSIRLKEQIISGGGRVYQSVLQVPSEERPRTIVISDRIVETPNYLLAVSLAIPVYRHDLIVNSCLQEKNVAQSMKEGMRLPTGRSIDTGAWVEKAPASPLSGCTCTLSLSSNQSTKNFWRHVLSNAGAKVITNTNTVRIRSGFHLSFILGDDWTQKDVIEAAKSHNIPVVTALWLMQTVIHGKLRPYNSHSLFTVRSNS